MYVDSFWKSPPLWDLDVFFANKKNYTYVPWSVTTYTYTPRSHGYLVYYVLGNYFYDPYQGKLFDDDSKLFLELGNIRADVVRARKHVSICGWGA